LAERLSLVNGRSAFTGFEQVAESFLAELLVPTLQNTLLKGVMDSLLGTRDRKVSALALA